MRTRMLHWGALARHLIGGLCLSLGMLGGLVQAAETVPPAETDEALVAETDEVLASLDEAFAQIDTLRPVVAELNERYQNTDEANELARAILQTRVDRSWHALVGHVHDAAGTILEQAELGRDLADYREPVMVGLQIIPDATFLAIDRRSAEIELPANDQAAAEQAAIYARASVAIARIDDLYDEIVTNLELQRGFGLDTSVDEATFNARLAERAAGNSAFLDMSLNDRDALSTQLATLPNDAEIAARLAVAQQRVQLSSNTLRYLTTLMTNQELDTTLYNAQLIAATGAITTDVFDVSVFKSLFSAAMDAIGEWFESNGGSLVFSVLLFVAIIAVAFQLARVAQRIVSAALGRSSVKVSLLLQRMIVSTSRTVIIVAGLLIALSQLGISLGPLLAGLGIAGFVIGFALQDTLSNFASGLMILFYKPFDVGDTVEVGGVFGTVNHMSLVNTTVLTFDNQTLVIPNNKIWGDVIKNVTSQRTRRVDMTFGIGYADDVPKAEKVLMEIIESHERVLRDPEPTVRLHELGDSSVNFVVRPWVKTDDYWPVYWDVTRAVKLAFDAQGISIPFPQRDVHVYTEVAPEPTTTVDAESASASQYHRREFNDTSAGVDDD
jgi:small conductance mechanosensitive channel